MKWRKDGRPDVQGSLIADGQRGRYQILRMSDREWMLYLPDGQRYTCDKLRAAKMVAEAKDQP